MDPMEEKVSKLLEKLQTYCVSHNRQDVFNDLIEYAALRTSLIIDDYKSDERKTKADKIFEKYKDCESEEFVELNEELIDLLLQYTSNFGDYLGYIAEELNIPQVTNDENLTPYSIARLKCQSALPHVKTEGKVLAISDPACGTGVLMIAAVDYLSEQGFNRTTDILVIAKDIDKLCVYMTFLQLSSLGVPAVVVWRDAITKEKKDSFITPAYVVQYKKFMQIYDAH